MCIVKDTAKRLGCSETQVFKQISETLAPTLEAEWKRSGIIPPYAESWCLDVLIKPNRLAQNLLGGTAPVPVMGLMHDLEAD